MNPYKPICVNPSLGGNRSPPPSTTAALDSSLRCSDHILLGPTLVHPLHPELSFKSQPLWLRKTPKWVTPLFYSPPSVNIQPKVQLYFNPTLTRCWLWTCSWFGASGPHRPWLLLQGLHQHLHQTVATLTLCWQQATKTRAQLWWSALRCSLWCLEALGTVVCVSGPGSSSVSPGACTGYWHCGVCPGLVHPPSHQVRVLGTGTVRCITSFLRQPILVRCIFRPVAFLQTLPHLRTIFFP